MVCASVVPSYLGGWGKRIPRESLEVEVVWAEITPLHSSLGNKSELRLKKKKKWKPYCDCCWVTFCSAVPGGWSTEVVQHGSNIAPICTSLYLRLSIGKFISLLCKNEYKLLLIPINLIKCTSLKQIFWKYLILQAKDKVNSIKRKYLFLLVVSM